MGSYLYMLAFAPYMLKGKQTRFVLHLSGVVIAGQQRSTTTQHRQTLQHSTAQHSTGEHTCEPWLKPRI
jgi:hypothetical protein